MTNKTMKNFRTGTHRTVTPQDTLNKIMPMLQAMGITRLANVTGLDDIGIPVFTACRPNAKAISVSQGKGISIEAAKASAAMEAIETYHAENIDLPTRFSSYHELVKSHPIVNLNQLPKMNVVDFDPDSRRLWIEANLLQSSKKNYVPYDLVHCDFTLPLPPGSGCFQISTNGLASGNTKDEASCHALCELIERDAMTLWSVSSKHRQDLLKLDLTTITDNTINALIKKVEDANIMIGIWNVTSDINIPTFVCTIMNKTGNSYRPLYPMSGSGTHPNKEVAIMRAVTEAIQTRLTRISGSRDDIGFNRYKLGQESSYRQSFQKNWLETESFIDFNSIDSWNNDTIEDDLNLLISQLAKQNLPRPMMVDLTKPEFDIPVVRVIAPGLEGIHEVPAYVYGKRACKFAEKEKNAQHKEYVL